VYQLLVTNGITKHVVDEDQRSLLHVIAEKNDPSSIAEMKFLLNNGAFVDVLDLSGKTPLGSACSVPVPYPEKIKILLENKANIESYSKEGTPLYIACIKGHTNMVKVLLDSGAMVDARCENANTPLIKASACGHNDIVSMLLEKKANIDFRDKWGKSSLHWASAEGKLNVIKILLEAKANVLAESIDGSTAMCEAAWSGHLDVIKYLVENGAAIDAVNTKKKGVFMKDNPADFVDRTPLFLAAENGKVPVVEYLISKGADVKYFISGKLSILHMAAMWSNSVEIIRMLLAAGASVNAKSSRSSNALHYAVETGSNDIISFLMEQNCDINTVNSMGYNPFHLAVAEQKTDTIRTILSSNYDVKKDKTALYLAVKSGSVPIVKLLLDSNCDPNLQTDHVLLLKWAAKKKE